MKKVAIFLDGGYVLKRLRDILQLREYPSAEVIYEFARKLASEDEEIFRIFFYYAEPFKGIRNKPISHEPYNFAENPLAKYTKELFNKLAPRDYIALRKGELLFQGWKIKHETVEKLKNKKSDDIEPLVDEDFEPEFIQKGVDIKIGLDVAWLASKKIVDRVIMVCADSDFVPAMKFARKEGIQVVLIKVGLQGLKSSLLEHSDLIRQFYYDRDTENWVIKTE